MRWLILADVHANLEALDAVLSAADARWGRLPIACAGDVVGWGPSPNECIARLHERRALCVLGNHDLMVLGCLPEARCSPAGLAAVEWTRQHLTSASWHWLTQQPLVREAGHEFVLFHGSLVGPDEYTASLGAAAAQLALAAARLPRQELLVCGHTHMPAWVHRGKLYAPRPGQGLRRDPGERALMNPGSVGQSRTQVRAARYAVLDGDAGEALFAAADYDVAACARKIRAAGLQSPLFAGRLESWGQRVKHGLKRAAAVLGAAS